MKSVPQKSSGVYVLTAKNNENVDGDILFKPYLGTVTILQESGYVSHNYENVYNDYGSNSGTSSYDNADKLTISECKQVYEFIHNLLDNRKELAQLELKKLEEVRANIDKQIEVLKAGLQ